MDQSLLCSVKKRKLKLKRPKPVCSRERVVRLGRKEFKMNIHARKHLEMTNIGGKMRESKPLLLVGV